MVSIPPLLPQAADEEFLMTYRVSDLSIGRVHDDMVTVENKPCIVVRSTVTRC